MPFLLKPPVQGKYRWLSTYIITFQPTRDWAADLEVEFQWNLDLETHDGIPHNPPHSFDLCLFSLSRRSVHTRDNHEFASNDDYFELDSSKCGFQ